MSRPTIPGAFERLDEHTRERVVEALAGCSLRSCPSTADSIATGILASRERVAFAVPFPAHVWPGGQAPRVALRQLPSTVSK